ncbi:MAG: hypothetical protein QME57_05375, partial [Patescibacteria group bacterium]|nr:hypothetical protein [Patescibacteria group bacterium]
KNLKILKLEVRKMLFDEGKNREVTTLKSGDKITYCRPNCVILKHQREQERGGYFMVITQKIWMISFILKVSMTKSFLTS